jgi:uncharacterized membrane protein YhaH (DUF805 family)
MLTGVPVLLAIFAALLIGSYKQIKGRQSKVYFWATLGIVSISAFLCVFFAIQGSSYIDHYQSLNSDCPSRHPYSWPIVVSGLVGFVTFICLATLLFRQRLNSAGWMTLVSGILFILFVAGAWILSLLCFTF